MIGRIALNNIFQKLILKTRDKKFLEKINRNLPLAESLFATSLYIIANERNKDIPKERKVALNWQTIIGGGLGALLSKSIDGFANKHKNKICLHLEKMNIHDSKKIIAGTRIAVPLIITTFISRYFMSTISTPASTFLAHIQRNNKVSKNTLDKTI